MERACTKCGVVKPLELFSKHKACRDGYQRICKECKNAYLRQYMADSEDQRRKRRQRQREWRFDPENRAYENAKQYQRARDDPETRALWARRHLIKKKYGITLEQYDEMVEVQGGGCAVCGGPPEYKQQKYFHVDHCHETGQVRGLLCLRCNTGIGLLHDSPEIMAAAIRYVADRRLREGDQCLTK